ncbi:MAG: hypothetical protein QOJ32_278 [Frankiaceae bacterium]|nr:hypothetical protein [Frankiaceae bacterium]
MLFADAGLSDGQISLLFTIWSLVGVVAELPTGVLADRYPRQHALAAGSVLQSVGFAAWTVAPTFPGFAVGFVLWGIGGAFVSGADEALLYDGLAGRDGTELFPAVLARARAAALVAQAPAAGAASLLFWLGGYPLVGWVSVAGCLGVAVLAATLRQGPVAKPELTPLEPTLDEPTLREPTLREPTLRDAVAIVRRERRLRLLLVWVAALAGLDAIEEYVPLLARHWTLPVTLVPAAVLAFSLAGAVGAASGHRLVRLSERSSGGLVMLAGVLLAATSFASPLALLAALAFYLVYQAVLIPVGVRLQDAVDSRHRATLTSAVALGSEVTALACYAAWAGAQAVGLALLVLLVGLVGLGTAARPHRPG